MGQVAVRRHERWARIWAGVYLSATLAALVGWAALQGRSHPLFWVDVLYGLINVPVGPSLVSVAVCGVLAAALLRRKRIGLAGVAAWQVAGIYTGVAELLRWPAWDRVRSWWSPRAASTISDIASVPIGVGLLIVAWRIRGAFPARLRAGSWLSSLAVFAVGVAASALVVVGALAVTGEPPSALVGRLPDVVARVLGFEPWRRGTVAGFGSEWLLEAASLLVALSLLAATLVFLRTARDPHSWSAEQEIRLRGLIAAGASDDSLAYFATRRDKEAVFAPGGDAAVTYRVVQGVCLASGDPVGRRGAWPAAIAAWLAEARGYGWIPAVVGAGADGARAYADAGLGVLYLGDEAVVDATTFAESDRQLAPVFRAARRAASAGVRVEIRPQSELTGEELAERGALAARWRRGIERGFSMSLGRIGDAADPRVLHVAAVDRRGAIVALLSFVPWGRGGLSLDLMRRSPAAPPGVNELMITDLLSRAGELGFRRLSLNFCMFRRTFEEGREFGSGVVTRLNTSVLGRLDRFWQLERLYLTNRRYRPEWRPRYLCLGDALALPQVALATAVAEGFVGLRVATQRPRGLSPEQLTRAAAAERLDAAAVGQPERQSPGARVRRGRLDALREAGRDPYPPATRRPTTELAGALGAGGGAAVTVSGRVGRVRDHGGVLFADLVDGGSRVQAVWDAAALGRDDLDRFRAWVDSGDILLVSGQPGRSRNGTASLLVTGWQHAAKALRPLPDARRRPSGSGSRRRVEELIVRPEAAAVLRGRSAVIRALRRTLDDAGFLEVETPILQAVHGGAAARPFRTHANAAGMDLTLRIAPELYLKRLAVAGLSPVYEIGRNFRNEGMDASHHPEFTALEAYAPYTDYEDMRRLAQELVRAAAVALHGRPVLPLQGGEVDLSGDWPVVPVLDAVSAALGASVDLGTPLPRLRALAGAHGVHVAESADAARAIEDLYGKLVEPRTVRPTFFRDFPAESSPLTRPHRSLPGLAERWDLVAGGRELGTAYTELADPVEQRRRLTAQSLRAAAGDPEAMEVDQDFLAALELGMPPTGGLGLGVDRLLMLLTGLPIRGVLSFPLVRPERSDRAGRQEAS